ncbi:MAG: anhydro-N-acetylmuramic acid kinase [Pseudomonadota bacterium]
MGLISGTSLDGIDAALLKTDGERIVAEGPATTVPYTDDERTPITAAIEQALDWAGVISFPENPPDVSQASAAVTAACIRAIQTVLEDFDGALDVIGCHGQTILHRPEARLTWQIGDGDALARHFQIPVVHQFRLADVANGGEGAPFAPVYHMARLANARGAPLANGPIGVLNLGGVGNLTLCSEGQPLIAFDTGPANGLVDQWVQQHGAGDFDSEGRIAAEGAVDHAALQALSDHPFFERPPPKSLDRYDFSLEPVRHLSLADGAATLTAFSAHTVAMALRHIPQCPGQIFTCGGGRHNRTLMAMIAAACATEIGTDRAPKIAPVESIGWRGDMVEAEAFAFLAVRSLRKLPISYPMTTGVASPALGGVHSKPETAA